MSFNIGIDLTNDEDAGGGCGWQWFCYDCGKEYCSGCTTECPECGSKRVSFKGWASEEMDIENGIKELYGDNITLIKGNFFQWLKIKWWNFRHPEYLSDCV